MSKTLTLKTNMKDKDTIVEVLKHLGVPVADIQVSENNSLQRTGYERRNQGCDILIARTHFGGYGDLGYQRGTDGTYSALVDDLDDRNRLRRAYGEEGVPLDFTKQVSQWYAAKKAERGLKRKGLKTKTTRTEDKRQLQCVGVGWR